MAGRGATAKAAARNERLDCGWNSLVAGKNAGNFAESAFSCEQLSRKHLQIQLFMDEFLRRRAGNFCQRRELIRASREFGAKPIRAPAHPIALKYFIAVDIKIINGITEF